MKTKILINEINRIQKIINISENKELLKEGLSDELVDLLTKFLSKGSDELINLGVKNADELKTLIKNFPTANVLDQTSILRTIISGLSDDIVKNIAKNAINDVTTGIGKKLNDRVTTYLDWYKQGIMTYDNVISQVSDDMSKITSKTSDELNSLKNSLSDEIKIKTKNSLDKIKTSVNSPQIKSSDPQSYLDNLSKEELDAKIGSYSWKNIGYDQELMSGWKFHIFGEDIKDAVYLQDALKPVIDKYKPTAKVGGTYQNSADSFKSGQVQYGKQGVTIYIPPNVINSGRQQEMLADIQSAISGYKKGGTISGDQSITPQIHYRYELMGPVPKNGIDKTTYSKMYSANDGGLYKPDDVEDIFTTNNNSSSTIKTVKSIGDGFLTTKFGDTSKINWDLITNAKNITDYDIIINDSMKTGDFSKVSRSGFEDYGIPNFREYLIGIYNSNK
jgi:hypothetical protein